jgi:hypothetical protein
MIGIEFRDIFVVSPLSEKEFKNKKETNIKNAQRPVQSISNGFELQDIYY